MCWFEVSSLKLALNLKLIMHTHTFQHFGRELLTGGRDGMGTALRARITPGRRFVELVRNTAASGTGSLGRRWVASGTTCKMVN